MLDSRKTFPMEEKNYGSKKKKSSKESNAPRRPKSNKAPRHQAPPLNCINPFAVKGKKAATLIFSILFELFGHTSRKTKRAGKPIQIGCYAQNNPKRDYVPWERHHIEFGIQINGNSPCQNNRQNQLHYPQHGNTPIPLHAIPLKTKKFPYRNPLNSILLARHGMEKCTGLVKCNPIPRSLFSNWD